MRHITLIVCPSNVEILSGEQALKLYIYGDDENKDNNVGAYKLILSDTTNKDIVIIESTVNMSITQLHQLVNLF